jgi:uncharacterized protein (TIGR02246 family)
MNNLNEEEEIKKLVTNMRDAWNRGDIKSFDSAFAEDVDFVDTAGKPYKGRDQIEGEHMKEIEGRLKGSQMDIDEVTVRFLQDEIAVVHISTNIRPGNRHTIMTAITMKEDGKWIISAAQNSIKI